MADGDKKYTAVVKAQREEFAGLDRDGLLARLDAEKKALWTLRFTQGKRQLQDTAALAKSRKTIARIHTYLRKLELQETK
jgi:ribosomal protein L29